MNKRYAINGWFKTYRLAAVFLCRPCFLRIFPFLSLIIPDCLYFIIMWRSLIWYLVYGYTLPVSINRLTVKNIVLIIIRSYDDCQVTWSHTSVVHVRRAVRFTSRPPHQCRAWANSYKILATRTNYYVLKGV